MRRALLAGIALLTTLAAACGGDSEDPLRQALRRMALQPQDLPETFSPSEESFTTNEDRAADAADPDARLAQLESWGRVLGYDVAYLPAEEAAEAVPAQGINVSLSVYRTEDGAAESFDDAVRTAEETDWAATYLGLAEFQQEEVKAGLPVDEVLWLRLSGFEPLEGGRGPLVTDDLVSFREGTVRGFLRVLARSTDATERGHYRSAVEGWLRALIDKVRDTPVEIEEEA